MTERYDDTPSPGFDMQRFAYRMTCLMLLHPVDAMPSALYFRYSSVMSAHTVEDIEAVLWACPSESEEDSDDEGGSSDDA